jgi:hypothetical protein
MSPFRLAMVPEREERAIAGPQRTTIVDEPTVS